MGWFVGLSDSSQGQIDISKYVEKECISSAHQVSRGCITSKGLGRLVRFVN